MTENIDPPPSSLGKKPILRRVSIAKLFERADPRELAAAQAGRALAKGFFDFMRNLLIVAAMKVLANKSPEHFLLSALYTTCSVALFLDCYSYVQSWNLKLFRHLSDRTVWLSLDVAFNLILSILFCLYTLSFLSQGISEIARLQAR